MCVHNVSGHSISCQAVHTPYILYIVTNIHFEAIKYAIFKPKV